MDIDTDPQGDVLANGKGMSVSPAWRELPSYRVSIRLRHLLPTARGKLDLFCYRLGTGPFQAEPVGPGLVLLPDSPTHGVVAPEQATSLARYEADLAATRPDWVIDEG